MDKAGNVSAASSGPSVINVSVGAPAAVLAPTQAVLQNYNHLAFDDEFTSTVTIDMSNSHAAGFHWYLQNWFSSSSTNPNDVSISNGVLELGGGSGGASLVSAFASSSGGY